MDGGGAEGNARQDLIRGENLARERPGGAAARRPLSVQKGGATVSEFQFHSTLEPKGNLIPDHPLAFGGIASNGIGREDRAG